jgi:FixJ family two-component response regulator
MRGSLESGAVGFINKPYDIKRLLHEVRAALDTEMSLFTLSQAIQSHRDDDDQSGNDLLNPVGDT